MRLVDLLARELDEWPKSAYAYAQDADKNTYPWTGTPKFDGGDWLVTDGANIDSGSSKVFCFQLASDYETAVVTKKQWQAERDRQKGGEWKRHRGGKCPVAAGTKVSTRHRDGEVVDVHFQTAEYGTHKAVMDCVWKHDGSKNDIMSYKVVSQPQAEEVEVKDMNMGTLSYTVDIDTSPAIKALNELSAKWDQVESPFKWRDTVNELNAYIEEFSRERDELINRLALEGFALIPAMVAVVGSVGVDMSDWRNWKAGDIVECLIVPAKHEGYYLSGIHYKIKRVDLDDEGAGTEIDVYCERDMSLWCPSSSFKFISRP